MAHALSFPAEMMKPLAHSEAFHMFLTASTRPADLIAKVLATLHDLRPFTHKQPTRPAFIRWTSTWSTRLLVASSVLFGALALLAGLRAFHLLPQPALMAAAGLGFAVQALAVLSVLLHNAGEFATLVVQHLRRGLTGQDEAMHDHDMAAELLAHSPRALEATDRWLEQKIKRLERRQVRFFGGPDKLAWVALMAAGWTTWQNVGADLRSWEPSPLLFGLALLVGWALGGIAASRRVDELAYQRDLLQTAKVLVTVLAPPEEEEADFGLGPFPGTMGAVLCNDTPVLQ